MIRLGTPLALAFALMPPAAVAQETPQAAMRRLSMIVGTWDVEDTYTPLSGAPVRDVGRRTCALALRGQYVECVTEARNAASGREREYRWLLNYNGVAGRYEMFGVFSNWPLKATYSFRIDSAARTWRFRAPSSVSDGIEQWSWAELVFDGSDRATWTSYRNLETWAADDWRPSTVERWVRSPLPR